MMTKTKIVLEFMKRLQEAESTCDAKRLAELFAKDAELLNLTRQNTHGKHGQGGHVQSPHAFWGQYLHAFDRVQSHFTNVIDDGRTAVLEWHSLGSLPMGLPIEYNGVSILEYEGDSIRRFRTYYDSAAFLPHAARNEKTYSESVGMPEITNQATS